MDQFLVWDVDAEEDTTDTITSSFFQQVDNDVRAQAGKDSKRKTQTAKKKKKKKSKGKSKKKSSSSSSSSSSSKSSSDDTDSDSSSTEDCLKSTYHIRFFWLMVSKRLLLFMALVNPT